MLFFRKLFKLPGAKELGKSDCDALQSRQFTPDCEGYTWEDWHADVKEKYPIRYFFAETASDFVKYKLVYPVYKPIKELKYWFVSHSIPSRRYHMLDLRQPKSKDGYDVDEYKYGWRDTPERMLFAMFNLLDEFVKYELPNLYCPTEEEIKNAENDLLKWSQKSLISQREIYFEILAIHKWWTYDRKIEYKAYENMRHQWSISRKEKANNTEYLWKKMRAMEEEFERKTDEMIARLMKIRRNLWS